jgi:hypothetical protein
MVELLSQTDPSISPTMWEQFGPFAIVFVLMAVAIGWLLKDRDRTLKRATDAEAREVELYNRLIEQGERLIPVVERMEPIIRANTSALDRVRSGES